MSAPWAPKALRPAFDAANIGSRCFNGCPPRITIIDGTAWVCGCALLRPSVDCQNDPQTAALFRLGRADTLPPAAAGLRRIALPGAGQTIAAARPFPGTAAVSDFLPPGDVTTAQGLGVDAWRWLRVGPTPGLLGMRGDEPVALIALLAKHLAAFERFVRAS